MERHREGNACGTCGRDEVGLLECQHCHQWIVNVRTRANDRLCAECAPAATTRVDADEVGKLEGSGQLDPGAVCGECGRDELGFNCCAKCGDDIIHRLESGVRLCGDCAVEVSKEQLAEAVGEAITLASVEY
jgi:hypothetical protein